MEEHFILYVESRLQQWAEWYSTGNYNGLGYPPCSMEYRILTEGAFNKYSGPKLLPSNPAAEEIEDLVREMSKQNENLAIALRAFYFLPGGLRTKAAKIHISHVHLKYYVDMAHQWLIGRMSG